MPEKEEYQQQLMLLKAYRDRLFELLTQQSKMGVYTPAHINIDIRDTRKSIALIKHTIRSWDIKVEDNSIDEDLVNQSEQVVVRTINDFGNLLKDQTKAENPTSKGAAPITFTKFSGMEKLKQVLAQEDTILFIGSGISMWSNLPSWSDMIEELAQFVESAGAKADLIRAEADKGDLLQAASYGFDKLTKQQVGEFIRATCRYGVAKPHEIHRKIVSLGPRCFVTTNYDDLIEQSLHKWQPDRFFRPPITNRHLTETAGIVHARAIDFIFKPHGDAADNESIILTREQYRQLLPQGERQAALEALKMLLASRPVVYLGFNLRDPDFIYIRDLLANTYKGGTRDHYAIMADISDAESDYWRRNYGIHLVNYATTEHLDKTRDHTELLILLDNLSEKAHVSSAKVGLDVSGPDVVLALARYAAGLARSPKLTPEFQIRVHADTERRMENGSYYRLIDQFDHYSVESFLDDGPERMLLIGLPGAGKTYSLRRATARLAEKLYEACLLDSFDEKAVVVPIWADLKLYQGSLDELIGQTLPKNLPFDEVLQHFKVKIFLDSFNEMPREYWESGSYESDFAGFMTRIADSSLVVSSRTNDGLSKMELPIYHLDEIDEAVVEAEIQRLGIELEGRFEGEIRHLLQRPFYFQYLTNGMIRLPKDAHPRDFYQALFEHLRKAFTARFSEQFDIEKALSLVAYNALNRGEEAFPLSELLRILKTSLQTLGLVDTDTRDIANWLVSSSIVTPYTGGRVAFVHQSITEYLAATELARRYQARPNILKEKLSLTRWDQALFLTLSLLPPTQADVFLQDVIRADLALALNATKYLEVGRDEVVSKLLSEIPERIHASNQSDMGIAWIIESRLPVTEVHESHLRALIKCGSSLGAAAVLRLVALKGSVVKDELLEMLVEFRSDYNLCCNGIARALRPFSTDEDAKKIAAWADSIQSNVMSDSEDIDSKGFISGAGAFLSGISLSTLRQAFLLSDSSAEISEIRAHILCEVLEKHHSTAALDFAGELLLRGVNEAAITIYFIANFAKPENNVSWASFSAAHVNRLVHILDEPEDESWGVRTLKCLCAGRPDLAETAKQIASKKSGIGKAILLYCISPSNLTLVFQALDELSKMNNEERWKQPIHLLKRIEFDWAGNEELFVQLLRLRDMQLASALFGGSSPPTVPNLGNLEIGPIDWWMEWMMDVSATNPNDWFLDQLGRLFVENLDRNVQDTFVTEFSKLDSRFRQLLAHYILPHRDDITTDVFSEDAISFLLADLGREFNMFGFRGSLLGNTATEQFINEHLLPLLPDAKQPLLKNLHAVLKQAGSRHGRRYILE